MSNHYEGYSETENKNKITPRKSYLTIDYQTRLMYKNNSQMNGLIMIF